MHLLGFCLGFYEAVSRMDANHLLRQKSTLLTVSLDTILAQVTSDHIAQTIHDCTLMLTSNPDHYHRRLRAINC